MFADAVQVYGVICVATAAEWRRVNAKEWGVAIQPAGYEHGRIGAMKGLS